MAWLFVPLFLLAGMALWTFAEYALHRWVMHEMRGKGLPSREHLLHHADPYGLTGKPGLSWAAMILAGLALWAPLGWWLAGHPVGASLGAGWIVGYAVYERLHDGAHAHAPRNAYGAWLRRHHFFHHLGHPLKNHGVTTPVWDMVFGTFQRPGRLRVPRRMVMPWLVDAAGEVQPEYTPHYEVAGAAARTDRMAALDRARAVANQVPAA